MKNINLAIVTAVGLFASAFSAHAGAAVPPSNVPEAGQTLLLLGVALITVIGLRYKLAK